MYKILDLTNGKYLSRIVLRTAVSGKNIDCEFRTKEKANHYLSDFLIRNILYGNYERIAEHFQIVEINDNEL